MNQETRTKTELIIAGLGGMGVLSAGNILATAALKKYKYTSWLPGYGSEKRGGLCECTMVISNEEIASPILDTAQTVMLLDSSQAAGFADRVRSGGLMIVERTGLEYEPAGKDFRMVPISGLEKAVEMGGSVMNNLIMLGVYTELVEPLPPEFLIEEIERRYADKESVLALNKKAFNYGLEMGKQIGSA
ncbi:MAG: 2-oxoacid:acceptor oxidoreductase family protein [Deltaproteobacteria bacterium]|jgi:2-oxoglutarate ferredoxin oxidoreductase subunit gamma|nr:2-oxoacid:acceptor oxidoreductase family protein [Deltaproteobacteria bacterium]MBW2144174.1 2-oxoacid:acceptor oxidoreductase family protein [Deltaproteobacteria bacterium]